MRKTRQEIGKGNQMTALRFQTCSPHNYGRQCNDAVSRPIIGLTSESWSERFTSHATFIVPRVSAEGQYICHFSLLYLMCVQLVNISHHTQCLSCRFSLLYLIVCVQLVNISLHTSQCLSCHAFQLKGNIRATFHYCT